MTTKRKPYVREIPATWWKSNAFYRFYMLRESTAIFAIWFCLVLLYGVFCLKSGIDGVSHYLVFLRHPLVVILNIISLAAALLHTKTWFELAPKAANLIVKGKKVPPCTMVKAMWAVTIVASLVILLLVFI